MTIIQKLCYLLDPNSSEFHDLIHRIDDGRIPGIPVKLQELWLELPLEAKISVYLTIKENGYADCQVRQDVGSGGRRCQAYPEV